MPAFFLVLDLEATCCDQNSIQGHQTEIIEVGAVMVNPLELEVVDSFQRFVRPVFRPQLTPFCRQLTGITQEQVDGAQGFATVNGDLRLWLQKWPGYLFCSWGSFDKRQFKLDCKRHRQAYPFLGDHLDLKEPFRKALNLKKKCGLAAALAHAGLEFEGHPHRAICDATNTARLLPFILCRTFAPEKKGP